MAAQAVAIPILQQLLTKLGLSAAKGAAVKAGTTVATNAATTIAPKLAINAISAVPKIGGITQAVTGTVNAAPTLATNVAKLGVSGGQGMLMNNPGVQASLKNIMSGTAKVAGNAVAPMSLADTFKQEVVKSAGQNIIPTIIDKNKKEEQNANAILTDTGTGYIAPSFQDGGMTTTVDQTQNNFANNFGGIMGMIMAKKKVQANANAMSPNFTIDSFKNPFKDLPSLKHGGNTNSESYHNAPNKKVFNKMEAAEVDDVDDMVIKKMAKKSKK